MDLDRSLRTSTANVKGSHLIPVDGLIRNFQRNIRPGIEDRLRIGVDRGRLVLGVIAEIIFSIEAILADDCPIGGFVSAEIRVLESTLIATK